MIEHRSIVGTDIDVVSTYLGGSHECVDSIVRSRTFESARVKPDDGVRFIDDRLNPPPFDHWLIRRHYPTIALVRRVENNADINGYLDSASPLLAAAAAADSAAAMLGHVEGLVGVGHPDTAGTVLAGTTVFWRG
jgi:hypothetical protein